MLLANLNSTLHRFIANGLNPGIDFNVGDAKRFPVKSDYKHENELEELIEAGVDARRSVSALTETSADYDGSAVIDTFENVPEDLRIVEESMKAHTLVVHGVTDTLIFDEYDISQETRSQMYANLPKNTTGFPVAAETHVEYPTIFNKHLTVETVGENKLNEAVETLEEMDEPTLREAALKTELSVLTVAQLRYDHELYSKNERAETAGRTVSLIVGALFDRWNIDCGIPSVSDEILAFETGPDITKMLDDALALVFEDEHAAAQSLRSALDHDPVEWLRERFFRYHHADEYKARGERNPIYWQLESANGGFSCFVYYHNIDENTLPKIRGQYLDPYIDELKKEIESLNAQTSGDNPDKELLSRREEVQNNLEDVNEFRETIDQMINDRVTVDVEKGVWENIKEWDRYEVLETGLPKLKSSYSR